MSLFFKEEVLGLLLCSLSAPWHNELFEDGFHARLGGTGCFGVTTIGLQVRVKCRLEPLMREELLAAIDDGYPFLTKEWGSCQRIQPIQQAEKPGGPLEQEGMK